MNTIDIFSSLHFRQFGFSNRKHGSELFEQRMYGSLHSVQRLELMYKLEHHDGCVNSLNFNHSGTLLASGSDDLKICLWNWPVGKLLCSFESGHKSNVFQVLPCSTRARSVQNIELIYTNFRQNFYLCLETLIW